jgi:hypothetical protein
VKEFAFWAKIGLFFLAVALLFGGGRLGLPFLTALGWLVFSGLAVFTGVEVIVTREASFFRRRSGHVTGRDTYSGCAAQLWGAMFVLFGLGLSLGSLAAMLAPEQTLGLIDRALDEAWGWGILIAVLGSFTYLYGLARVLAGGAEPSRKRGIRHLGYRLFGAAVLLAGLGLVGIGLVLVVFPDAVHAFLGQWFPALESR